MHEKYGGDDGQAREAKRLRKIAPQRTISAKTSTIVQATTRANIWSTWMMTFSVEGWE
jgi:hypothetical protein